MFFLLTFVYSAHGTYCDSGNNYAGDSNLGKVHLAEIDDNSNNCESMGVQDMTSSEETATLAPGGTYTLTFEATTCNSAYPRQASAYIDWNCNGDFTDDQALFSPIQVDGSNADPIEFNKEFTVPSDATTGCDSRLRVIVMELPSATSGPCGKFNYGAAKDFKVVFDNHAPTPGGKGGSGGLSTGSAILIALIVVLVLYIVVGLAFGIKKQGKSVNDAFPQKEFWLSFPGLVKDGVMFTKGKLMGLAGKGGSAAYDEL